MRSRYSRYFSVMKAMGMWTMSISCVLHPAIHRGSAILAEPELWITFASREVRNPSAVLK
jgi:hypothetical protein